MKFPKHDSDIGINPINEKNKTLTGKDFFVLWSSLGVGLLVISAGSFIYTSNILGALFVIILGSIVGSVLLGLAGKIGSDHSIPIGSEYETIIWNIWFIFTYYSQYIAINRMGNI